MKDQPEIIDQFIFTPHTQLQFSGRSWLGWLLFFLVLSTLFTPTFPKFTRSPRRDNKSSSLSKFDEPKVSVAIETYPPGLSLSGSGSLFTEQTTYYPWWHIFIEEDESILSPVKTPTYFNFPIIGKAKAVTNIYQYFQEAFKHYIDPVILEEIALIRKGVPELQIVPVETSKAQHLKDAEYNLEKRELSLRAFTNSSEEQFEMIGHTVHELKHAFSDLAEEVLDYPSNKEQEIYAELWAAGDNKIKNFITYLNELHQIQQKSIKDSGIRKRIKHLEKELAPLRNAAKDLIDHPYFSSLTLVHAIPVNLLKTQIAEFREQGIEFEVGHITTLDSYTNLGKDIGLKSVGKVKIIKIIEQQQHFTIKVIPQDPAVAFIQCHHGILNHISYLKPKNVLAERHGYTRGSFPPSLRKYIWDKVEQHDTEIRKKVAAKLSSIEIPTVPMPDFRHYELVAEKTKKPIHRLEKSLQRDRPGSNTQTTNDLLNFYYNHQLMALIKANQMDKAEKLLAEIISKNRTNETSFLLVGQLHFLRKDYAKAVEHFKQIKSIDNFYLIHYPSDIALSFFYYGTALLKINKPAEAVEKLKTACEWMEKNDAVVEILVSLCRNQLNKALAAAEPLKASQKSFR